MRTPGAILVLVLCSLTNPVKAGDRDVERFWHQLHKFERTALNDYRSRNSSASVLKRSREIWELQSSTKLGTQFAACASAAQNLSQMVSSSYYDANMGRIPTDWFFLSTRYRAHREHCLTAIGLNEDSYPLPWWFGS